MSRTKPTSAKQIAANRRNAQKSTGPRTEKGRAVSKMNALKHGILSKQVLVKSVGLKESDREFAALHRRFWDDLKPVGPLEEMLVDQIVTAHWRLRRAMLAESGEIAKSANTTRRLCNQGTNPVLLWMQWRRFGDPVYAMEKSSLGSKILEDWLYDLRREVELVGWLSTEMVENLNGRIGGGSNSLGRQLMSFCAKNDGGSDAADREQKKAAVLAFLDRRIGSLQRAGMHASLEEMAEDNARQAAAILPSAEVLEKIMRYETKLERQMYRAMAQLERIQRMRNGEAIPAPLSVEITERR